MAEGKYWFKHDNNADDDPKLTRVFMRLGHEGKSVFWSLLQMLHKADGFLYLSDVEPIAHKCYTSKEVLNSLLQDFELFKNDGERFWNDRVIRDISNRQDTSRKNTENVRKRWDKQTDRNTTVIRPNTDRNTTVILEDRRKKIEERKENIPPISPKGGVSVSLSGSPEFESEFVWFWEAYGKKVDSSKCKRKFKNLTKAERDAIREHVPKYVASTPDSQYRKNPLTYLNGRCWEDEISVPATTNYGTGLTHTGLPKIFL